MKKNNTTQQSSTKRASKERKRTGKQGSPITIGMDGERGSLRAITE